MAREVVADLLTRLRGSPRIGTMATLFAQENDDSIGSYEMYKSEADALFRNGSYRKAIDRYTKALKCRPDDKVCFVCRSKCYLMLGDTDKALQDADASLAEKKNYYLGIFQKAEVLYRKGDFEMALVFYHRGNKLRPEFQNFRLGIQKAQESICNCVGTPDRIKLNTSGDLSFFAAHIEKKSKRKGVLCTQTQQTVQRMKKPLEKRGNEKTIKQMLGDLYGDRKFMERLLLETDNKTITGKQVVSFADEGLTYLDKLAEFWQQVKPLYARKYEQRLALNRGRSAKISPHDYIQLEVEKIETLLTEGNYEAVLQRSEKVMALLATYNEVQLSNKMTFIANLCSLMGNAYLELDDFDNAVKEHQMDLDIGVERFLDHAELRALDNLGRVYAKRKDFTRAIEVWERKLPMSKEESETAWLCLELGRCYLELDNMAVARDYGEKSLAAAKEISDDRWKLHAYVLISQAEAKAGHLSSALISFEKAYELAVLLRDNEAKNAIRNAIADVETTIEEREVGKEVDFLEYMIFSADDQEQQTEAGSEISNTEEQSVTNEKMLKKVSFTDDPQTAGSVKYELSETARE